MGRILHNVTIENIKAQYLTVSINSERNYGIGANKNVALQIILEAYEELCTIQRHKSNFVSKSRIDGLSYNLSSISWKEAENVLSKSTYHQTFENWLNIKKGQEIKITKSEYDLIRSSGHFEYKNQEIITYGGDEETDYFVRLTPYKKFVELAETTILDIKIIEEEESWSWINFEVEVLDEGIIAHLSKGISWESCICDYDEWV
jgi:hypothetical protein